MPSKEDIYQHVNGLLIELFEVQPDKISPEAQLKQDLEIDSIDAIDLILKLRDYTGRKIKPEEFKNVRTVDDVVNAVHALTSAAAA
jgi:acyl carrier protein